MDRVWLTVVKIATKVSGDQEISFVTTSKNMRTLLCDRLLCLTNPLCQRRWDSFRERSPRISWNHATCGTQVFRTSDTSLSVNGCADKSFFFCTGHV